MLWNSSLANREKIIAERDLTERSTNKVNEGSICLLEKGISFKDIVAGRRSDDIEEENDINQDGAESTEDEYGDIRVEKGLIGGYECPNFIFSEKEEACIQRPWKRGVIVKLLGKKIGYKTLENRLNQMWVCNGIISIVDLSND